MPRGRKRDKNSVRSQRMAARVVRNDKIMVAIQMGIERGTRLYTKQYDRALSVLCDIEDAGFMIIPRPRKDKKNG